MPFEEYAVVGEPTVMTAETIAFRFEPEGWATFTLCEETGELSVRSDWGDGSYHWTKTGRGGRTLKDFLADRSFVDYLVDKLCHGEEFQDVYDAKATAEALREQMHEWLGPKPLVDDEDDGPSAAVGRYEERVEEFEDAIDSFTNGLDGNRSTNAFLHYPSEVYEFTENEPWFFLKTREPAWKGVWRHVVLPTLIAFLQKAGHGKPAVAPTTADS